PTSNARAIPDGTHHRTYDLRRLARSVGLVISLEFALFARPALAGDAYDPVLLSLPELQRLAFGERPPGAIHTFEQRPFVLLTDMPRLDGTAVLRTLDAMYRWTRRDFPFLLPPSRPVPLLVFASDRQFRS